MKGIYYIENTINEYCRSIRDWYLPKGTGTIYFQEYGLYGKTKVIYLTDKLRMENVESSSK